MKIEDVEKLWTEDCDIDSVRLDAELLNIPKLHHKYLLIYKDIKLRLVQLNIKYHDLEAAKNSYYTGKMSKEELDEYGWEPFQYKVLRNDIKTYLQSDKDLSKINTRIEYNKILLDYIESIIEQINRRNFIIKDAIAWRKFTAGEV